jgi:hypothetical protein
MTDTTKRAITLEDVRDWMRRLEKQHDLIPPLREAYGSAADAIDAHLSAQREGEAVGCLVITPDSTNQYGKNARFSYSEACMDLPAGEHLVYTVPSHPRVEMTDMLQRFEHMVRYENCGDVETGTDIGVVPCPNGRFVLLDDVRAAFKAALSEKGHE